MSGIDIFVDKITKSIEEAGTGKSLGTDVRRIAAVDLKGMLKKNGWKFNWRTEFAASERELYNECPRIPGPFHVTLLTISS